MFSTMQRQQPDLPTASQSRPYGHYIASNPSSTHSSPRSFPADLEPYYPTPHHSSNLSHSQTYPLPAGSSVNPYIPAQQRRPPYPQLQASRSSSYSSYTAPVPLQVSTSTSSAHDHDPNEHTARPGNAHVHAQFHSSLPNAAASSSSAGNPVPANGALGSDDGGGAGGAEGEVDGSSADGQPQQQQQQPLQPQTDYAATTPGLSGGFSRPLKPMEQDRLAHLDRLKFFLATAPSRWDSAATNANPPSSSNGMDYSPYGSGTGGYAPRGAPPFGGMGGIEPAYHHAPPHPALNRFLLPNQEFVTCVLWNGLYHITGTDIVRALVFRFEAFGRPVRNMKKFEEGVFSDLRNLKPGVDACLEEPKSPFLDLLFKYQCIRTQKKQKVFYWFSVPHDRLFLDALERDLKREKIGMEPTTQIVGEPAMSFTYDPKRSLYEQFSKAQGAREGEGELEAAARRAFEDGEKSDSHTSGDGGDSMVEDSENDGDDAMTGDERRAKRMSSSGGPNGMFTDIALFPGSPHYKIRRKKGTKVQAASALGRAGEDGGADDYEPRGRSMGGDGRFASLSRERGGMLPRPAHPSMRDEFGADVEVKTELNAAEMFMRQAHGELLPSNGIAPKPKAPPIVGEVPVMYSHGGPSDAQRLGMSMHHTHARGRSYDLSREAAQARTSGTVSAGYSNTPTFDAQQQQPGDLGAPVSSGTAMYEVSDGKVRAFVCPLYSCGRLFKRMEHLKRHLRTHTMERPFTCPRCNKKFSRSDNLTQHLRTHDRTDSGSMSGSALGLDAWVDGMDDADVSGEGSASGGSPRGGNMVDSDDDRLHSMVGMGPGGLDGLDLYGENTLGMPSLDLSQFNLGGNFDATMFEVEIPGGVQDVQGDEPGLLMRTGLNQQQQQSTSSDGYYPSMSSSGSTGLLFSTASGAGDFTDVSGWSSRPQTSPGYGNLTTPSLQAGNVARQRASLTSSPAGFMRNMHQSHHSTSSSASSYSEDFSSASLSAPSHKQTFDHSTLYPPSLLENSGGNIGPMRRHRSMTPSLIRGGESIRRPMTANSGEFQQVNGSPGSVSSSISSSSGAPRGYHPYAYSNSNSRANSTHSSPQVHPVPLTSEYAQIHRSESRNSSYGGAGGLHEQMRQMMNMNLDPRDAATGGAAVFGDNTFRSGSPASFHQTESPATFSMDLPMQYTNNFVGTQAQPHQIIQHASTMPVTNQYPGAQSQQQFDTYYNQHQHATL